MPSIKNLEGERPREPLFTESAKERKMEKMRVVVLSLVLIALSGCASLERWRARESEPERRTLQFVLQSMPEAAEVYLVKEDAEQLLGRTPLTISVPFEPQEKSGGLSMLQKDRWHPVLEADHPVRYRKKDESIFLDFSALVMRKQGFAPQVLSGGWTLPQTLQRKEGRWGRVAVAQSYEHTLVFRTPVDPSVTNSIVIDTIPSGATLHAFAADGSPGELIAETPAVFGLDFAPLRSETGAITNWVRWHGDTGGLWAHSPEGVVSLYGVLVLEGYDPQPVIDRPLFAVNPEEGQAYRLDIPMLRPAEPSVRLQLEVNSLPEGAVIYAVRPDGSLTNKRGETPQTFEIGLAQELAETPNGVIHADWRIWDPHGILSWENREDGSTVFAFVCAMHKEEFGVKHVMQPVFTLIPGQPIPEKASVTVPLYDAQPQEAKKHIQLPSNNRPPSTHSSVPGPIVPRQTAIGRPAPPAFEEPEDTT